MSASTDLKIQSAVKTVTTAGAREPLAVGNGNIRVRSVTIRALTTNTGNVHVGDTRVVNTPAFSYVLAAGEALSYIVDWDGWQHGEAINLNAIYLDVDVAGEGVCYTVMKD